MPFALNEATEFINPTKALEYMATARPVVSTAVEDVVLQFSDVCGVARSHEEFITFCQRAADQPDQAAIERGLALAGRNSWESIVARMEDLIEEALDTELATTAAASGAA